MFRIVSGIVLGLALAVWGGPCLAAEQKALRAMAAVGFGSVEDAGYGATSMFNAGYEFDDILSAELQVGMGITEEAGIGTERFFHLDLLLPAALAVCSSDSWICPGSNFEIVIISGIGISRFTVGRWSPNVVAGVALDSFRLVGSFEVGVRASILGHYDVIEYQRLVVILQLYLGVIFRFGLG
jgi:hypothetical protein